MRKAVLEESIVIEVIGVKLAVSFPQKVDNLAPIKRSIGHGGKLVLQNILSIIVS
jgi:hypothetical protein